MGALQWGAIGAESEFGKGSTFWFTLPYVPASKDVNPDTQRATESLEAVAANRSLHILVAEDNELNQQIIRAIVTDLGHTLAIADDGMAAVELHERDHFDLILSDVRMPVMSGPDATRLIRQMDTEEKAGIPIIALTADAMEDNKREYIDAGMNVVVTKPINRVELMLAINQVMNFEIHEIKPASPSSRQTVREQADLEEPSEEAQSAVAEFLKEIDASAD